MSRLARLLCACTVSAITLGALTGCSLGNVELSGPPNEPNVTTHANIHGKAIGGQNPLTYATIDLYTVSNTGYGFPSNLLTTVLSGTNQYYPGGTTGCNNTALAPTAYFIVSGTATITAVNSMIAGQLINISDSTSGLNGTYIVASATGTSFTVSTNLVDDAGIPSGSYVPVCYTHPTTDKSGNFNVSGDYTCSGSSILYIQGSGGNPGLPTPGTNNSSIVITALLQASPTSTAALTCASPSLSSTSVIINELTTAAMGIAMGQFFTTTYGGGPTTDGFGTSFTNSVGMTNAANTALQLVSSWTGTANTSYSVTNNGFSVTVAPEATKLQTIGDILASCVNGLSGNSHCTSLFGALNATSITGGTTPTDTLQAAVLFGLNPTAGSITNSNTLWSLVAASGAPFTALGSQPTDYTVGITYTDTSTGTPVLNDPYSLAVDASGNIWVANDGSAAGSLGELSPNGTPQIGTNFPNETVASTLSGASPRGVAIDLSGNVWLATQSSSGYLYEYTPGNPVTNEIPYAHLSKGPYGIAVDPSGNTFVGMTSATAPISIYEFPGGVGATSSIINKEGEFAFFGGAQGSVKIEFMAFDNSVNHGLWVTSGSALTTLGQIEPIVLCTPSGGPPAVCTESTAGGGNTYVGYTSASVGTLSAPSGMAAGRNGMWFANNSGNNITYLPLNTLGVYTASTQTAYGSATTIASPLFLAVDGSGNVWTADNAQTSPASIQELSSSGVVLSPASNAGTSPFNVLGFSHAGLTTGAGIAVDPSGNVWVANNTTAATVFELVGAGSPTYAPLAAALNGQNVGTRP